jgi:hypothetical protein
MAHAWGVNPHAKTKATEWRSFTLGYHYKTDAHRTFFKIEPGCFAFG